MSRVRTCLLLTLLLVGLGGTVPAQFMQDPADLGAADTVIIEAVAIPDVATAQTDLILELSYFNDANTIGLTGGGFSWDNPNFVLDSAVFSPAALAAFDLQRFVFFANNIDSSNANQLFQFAGVALAANLQPDPGRQLMATYYFTATSWGLSDSVVIDTNAFNSAAELQFIIAAPPPNNIPYVPAFSGTLVIRDTAFVPPANIQVAPDSLFFAAVAGEGNPLPQSVDITSSAQQLPFTLIENAPWLSKVPSFGTTPRNVSVSVSQAGLTPGLYIDSIEVDAPSAANNPQYIYVEFTLAEPLPEIGVSDPSFTFNALVGDPNPAPRTLTITNAGGGTLNWSVSNMEPWLTLMPMAGVDSGDVSVVVDISSLGLGTFTDTITVTASGATNDPVKIPVTVNLGSNLPTIELDSSTLFFVVALAELPNFSRSFEVRNGGIGSLTYSVTESAARIVNVDNGSGVAPDSVRLDFDVPTAFGGTEVRDTITITSPEAINSPLDVEVVLRFVATPANLITSRDTVRLRTFECQSGDSVYLPSSFSISNIGGDNPVDLIPQFSSSNFVVSPTAATAPRTFLVTPLQTTLPIGVYYDTITFDSPKDPSGPVEVIVEFTVAAPAIAPEIELSTSQVGIPYKEGGGPYTQNAFTVQNPNGGCLSWEIVEDVDWWFPVNQTGEAGEIHRADINGAGFPFGEYFDTLLVSSSGASNSPVEVPVVLRVWRFRGDVNYDSTINLADLSRLISFLFISPFVNAAPQPSLLIGDTDCNNLVELPDLTVLISYLFLNGPPPCNDDIQGAELP